MSTQSIIIIAVVVVALIAVIATQRSGPRVTQIETRRETKDSDDA